MQSNSTSVVIFAACCALSAPAAAYVGADTNVSFFTGLVHSFSGIDHLLAMFAVGMWSALAARRGGAEWLCAPLGFAGMLLVGALLGMQGVAPAGAEPMIAVSLLVIGLMASWRLRLPGAATVALVGVFALFHGLAHGAELAHASGATLALAGMALASLILHAIGLAAGWALRRAPVWLPRMAGMMVALFGGATLLQVT